MPTSDIHNIVPIMSIVENLQPRSVLDIGCGFGKYGFLMREYLDIWHGRYAPDKWQTRLIGIDAFPDYRTPVWDYVYDEVHAGEAQNVLPQLDSFDLIVIADVIEHFEHEDAVDLVRSCMERSPVTIISTPREFYSQDALGDNPYEIHRTFFSAKDVPGEFHAKVIPVISCDVIVVTRDRLAPDITYRADLKNLVYLQSRYRLRRLGYLGLPLSLVLRFLCRCLA